MTLEEVKKYIEENKSSDEVKAYLQGLVTVEEVQQFLAQNGDGKRWLDSERDKHLNKGLDTWKANNLQKEINKKIRELYPEETEEKKQLRELNAKIETMELEKQKEVLKNKALTIAADKKLPINKIVLIRSLICSFQIAKNLLLPISAGLKKSLGLQFNRLLKRDLKVMAIRHRIMAVRITSHKI